MRWKRESNTFMLLSLTYKLQFFIQIRASDVEALNLNSLYYCVIFLQVTECLISHMRLPPLCIFHTQWNRERASCYLISTGRKYCGSVITDTLGSWKMLGGKTSLHTVIPLSLLDNNETLFFLAQQVWKDQNNEAGCTSRWLEGASMNCISLQNKCYDIQSVIR